MSRPATQPDRAARSLFLVATDVAGRVSVLAGPYATLPDAAARVRDVVERLAAVPTLTGFGHVTVAEGAGQSASFFGRV